MSNEHIREYMRAALNEAITEEKLLITLSGSSTFVFDLCA
jgi:hypothetical protein